MAGRTVEIRLRPLLCPDLTPCTKLVSMALQMDSDLKRGERFSPTRIQKKIGVARPTARLGLRSLEGPYKPEVPDDLISLARTQVSVSVELITDKTLSANARVLYCVLKGLYLQKRYEILSSYTSIAKVLKVQARTVGRALRALAKAGWITISRDYARGPMRFKFPDRKAVRQRAKVRRAEQRLSKSEFYGEALALLWCDTLVDSTNYQDDCYPDFLVNPRTGELLQADRYYVDHKVVIEFNGPQHDGATQWFSQDEAEAQKARDRIKREICAQYSIPFITLRPEDLNLQRLREVLGKVLPLHNISDDEPIISFLAMRSQEYLQSIASIRQRSGHVT